MGSADHHALAELLVRRELAARLELATVQRREHRIRATMDRILAGTPQHSNGALTIVALALEAEVPRNALTQRHTDLKTEFYTRVQERGAIPEVETRLRATVAKLKETIANKNKELSRLRADVPALVRAVNQLTLENQRLQEALTGADGAVVPFRSRRPPHSSD